MDCGFFGFRGAKPKQIKICTKYLPRNTHNLVNALINQKPHFWGIAEYLWGQTFILCYISDFSVSRKSIFGPNIFPEVPQDIVKLSNCSKPTILSHSRTSLGTKIHISYISKFTLLGSYFTIITPARKAPQREGS